MKLLKKVLFILISFFSFVIISSCGKEKYTDDIWTVTFVNYDGSFLSYSKVKDGQTAFFNDKYPTKPSDNYFDYTFIGWDQSLDEIRNDCTVTAKYSQSDRYYTVYFQNYNGDVLDDQKCKYGESVEYHGITPTKPEDQMGTYTFIGWDVDLSNITETCFARAQFELNPNVFTWNFYDSDKKCGCYYYGP